MEGALGQRVGALGQRVGDQLGVVPRLTTRWGVQQTPSEFFMTC